MLESEYPYYTVCCREIRQGIKRCTIPKEWCFLFGIYKKVKINETS